MRSLVALAEIDANAAPDSLVIILADAAFDEAGDRGMAEIPDERLAAERGRMPPSDVTMADRDFDVVGRIDADIEHVEEAPAPRLPLIGEISRSIAQRREEMARALLIAGDAGERERSIVIGAFSADAETRVVETLVVSDRSIAAEETHARIAPEGVSGAAAHEEAAMRRRDRVDLKAETVADGGRDRPHPAGGGVVQTREAQPVGAAAKTFELAVDAVDGALGSGVFRERSLPPARILGAR